MLELLEKIQIIRIQIKKMGDIPDSGGFEQSSGHTFFVFLNKILEFFTEFSSRTENVKNRDQVSASGWHHHLLTGSDYTSAV
jgi:hypothetical protein